MKQILLLTATYLISLICNGQTEVNPDSILILNLQKEVKSAKGIKEVDLLNAIAWEYMWYGSPDKSRSYSYAAMAKQKAEAINYERGIGYASFMQAYQYIKSDKKFADSLFKTARNIGEKLKDSKLLGWYYYQQWDLKKALDNFRKAGDIDGEAEVVTWLCSEYRSRSEIMGDFSYCQRAIELAGVKKKSRQTYNKWMSGVAYSTLAKHYSSVGDYNAALNLIDKASKYSDLKDLYWDYAATYEQMGSIDSALFYYDKALEHSQRKWYVMRYAGYANKRAGNHKRAIELLEEASKLFLAAEKDKKGSPINWRGEIHSHLGEAYDSVGDRNNAIKNYKYALEHLRKFYQELQHTPKHGDKFFGYEGERQNWIMNVSKELSMVFSGLAQHDSSLFYLRRYVQVKEITDNKKKASQLNMQLQNFKRAEEEQKRSSHLQLLQKDNFIKEQQLQQQRMLYRQNEIQHSLLASSYEMKDQQLLLANQEIQIKDQGLKEQQFLRKQKESSLALLDRENKIKDQQLKQQKFFRNALLAGLFLLLALAVFIIRYLNLKRKAEKLKNEKVKAELEQQSSELKMQALRAQMNPHFIFNCLSSINRFILKHETESASDYLTRFSRLIRMVLINSQKSLIALEDEIDMLRLYLDMERLRFKDSFDYIISYTNTIESGSVFVPPLLLQPFCENAIWHGLMHKNGQGNLNICLSMKNNMLQCSIRDNGIGRKKAEALKTKTGDKSKSLGLQITKSRLALLNQNRNAHTFFEMNDLYDETGEAAGTEVFIKVRYEESVKELV